jgi:hypothetical protein
LNLLEQLVFVLEMPGPKQIRGGRTRTRTKTGAPASAKVHGERHAGHVCGEVEHDTFAETLEGLAVAGMAASARASRD